MIRFQADADLDFDIVQAVRRRERAVDFASAVDSHLAGLSDPEVLEVAASMGRVLITHSPPDHAGPFPRPAGSGQVESGGIHRVAV